MRSLVLSGGLSSIIVLSSCGCDSRHPKNGFYPSVRVGQGGTITPQGQRSIVPPDIPSFFEYDRGAFIASATHLRRVPGSDQPHIFFYMEFHLADDRLDRTVKTTQLFHGEFGDVSLQKTCFYNRSFATNLSTVAIGRFDGEGSPAKQVAAPGGSRTGSPTSRALLRVYRDGEGLAVVSGNYEADGMLRSLQIDHTRSGSRLFYRGAGGLVDPLGPVRMLSSPKPLQVGIPQRLDQDSGTSLSLPAAPLPVSLDLLFTVYGDGALVREEILREVKGRTARVETRYLEASEVEEQGLLEPACNRQLALQRASGKRTVE